jgi:ubiquinone/menaquinone biosynthesis C-methylase UbiE
MEETRANAILQEWRDSAQYWEKHAETIRSMFAPITRALIEDAEIRSGHNVLDVAGGAGEPALTIAELVGPSGSVTCTDAVAEMVSAARNEAQRRSATNVTFHLCAAESLPFPDSSFDTVVSRLGAMFFPDPPAALREMLRVTKLGGGVSLAVWYKSDLNPFCYLVNGVISRHVAAPPAAHSVPGAHDAFRFAELGSLADLLRQAGAIDVRDRVLNFAVRAPISAKGFWLMRSETSGTLRNKLAALSPDKRIQLAQEAHEALREYLPNDEMNFPAQVLIATGRKQG